MDRPWTRVNSGATGELGIQNMAVGNHWNFACQAYSNCAPWKLPSACLKRVSQQQQSWSGVRWWLLQIQAMSTPCCTKRLTSFCVCKKAEAHERTEKTKGASPNCSPEASKQTGAPKIPVHPLANQKNMLWTVASSHWCPLPLLRQWQIWRCVRSHQTFQLHKR